MQIYGQSTTIVNGKMARLFNIWIKRNDAQGTQQNLNLTTKKKQLKEAISEHHLSSSYKKTKYLPDGVLKVA